MNEKILLEALDCLDPALLDRTFLQGEKIAKRRKNLPRFRTILSVGTAAALVFVSVLLIWKYPNVKPGGYPAGSLYVPRLAAVSGDPIPEIKATVETEKQYGLFQDETMPRQYEVTVLGETFIGTYKYSLLWEGSSEPFHHYVVDGRYDFDIEEDGKLVGFSWGREDVPQTHRADYSEAEFIQEAFELLTDIIQIDLNDYVSDYFFRDRLQMHEVYFTKYLNGIETLDYVCVLFNLDGTPFGFVSQMLGMIPSEVDRTFDLEKAKSAVENRCDELTEEVRKSVETVEYVDWRFQLTLDEEGRFMLLTTVTIECTCDGHISGKKLILLQYI